MRKYLLITGLLFLTVSAQAQFRKVVATASSDTFKATIYGSSDSLKVTVFADSDTFRIEVFGSTNNAKVLIFATSDTFKGHVFGASDTFKAWVFADSDTFKSKVYADSDTFKVTASVIGNVSVDRYDCNFSTTQYLAVSSYTVTTVLDIAPNIRKVIEYRPVSSNTGAVWKKEYENSHVNTSGTPLYAGEYYSDGEYIGAVFLETEEGKGTQYIAVTQKW